MTKIKLLLMLLLAGTLARAQMLTPRVVSSGGKYTSAGGYSLSQNIGELVVATLTGGTNKLTEGFEQPNPDAFVAIQDPLVPGMSIKLYPNPASDHVSISILSDKDMDYLFTIVDAVGRQVASSSMLSASVIGMVHTLDVSNLATGMYFMVVESADRKFSKTIRFNKN